MKAKYATLNVGLRYENYMVTRNNIVITNAFVQLYYKKYYTFLLPSKSEFYMYNMFNTCNHQR